MNPKVSVIVPAYRTEPFIEECIKSILSQTHQNIEAVIVYERDDIFMRDLLERLYDHRIVPVKQKKNVGISNARNMGIDASSGELIALCDGDDLFYPEKLEKQVETIKSGSDLTYSDIAIIDDAGKIITTSVAPEWNFETWLRRTYVAASSILFTRELLSSTGPFREDLHANEDLDFIIRAAKTAKISRTPGILTGRRIHASNMSRNIFKNTGTRFRVYREHGYSRLAFYAAFKNLTLTPFLLWVMKHPSIYERIKKLR